MSAHKQPQRRYRERVLEEKCPRCGAEAGSCCTTYKGGRKVACRIMPDEGPVQRLFWADADSGGVGPYNAPGPATKGGEG